MKQISKEWRAKFINHIEANIEAYKQGFRRRLRYGVYEIFRVLQDDKDGFQSQRVIQDFSKTRGLCVQRDLSFCTNREKFKRDIAGIKGRDTNCNLCAGTAMLFYAEQVQAMDLIGKKRGIDLMYEHNANANIKQIEFGELGNFEQITEEQAREYAEAGHYVLATQYIPGKIGHVALVVGTRINPIRTCVYNIGALGREGYQDIPYAFGLSDADAQKKVKYYRHVI